MPTNIPLLRSLSSVKSSLRWVQHCSGVALVAAMTALVAAAAGGTGAPGTVDSNRSKSGSIRLSKSKSMSIAQLTAELVSTGPVAEPQVESLQLGAAGAVGNETGGHTDEKSMSNIELNVRTGGMLAADTRSTPNRSSNMATDDEALDSNMAADSVGGSKMAADDSASFEQKSGGEVEWVVGRTRL